MAHRIQLDEDGSANNIMGKAVLFSISLKRQRGTTEQRPKGRKGFTLPRISPDSASHRSPVTTLLLAHIKRYGCLVVTTSEMCGPRKTRRVLRHSSRLLNKILQQMLCWLCVQLCQYLLIWHCSSLYQFAISPIESLSLYACGHNIEV